MTNLLEQNLQLHGLCKEMQALVDVVTNFSQKKNVTIGLFPFSFFPQFRRIFFKILVNSLSKGRMELVRPSWN